jgi:hypothetical protein
MENIAPFSMIASARQFTASNRPTLDEIGVTGKVLYWMVT